MKKAAGKALVIIGMGLALAWWLLPSSRPRDDQSPLKMAVTTSSDNSGLLEHLQTQWPFRVDIVVLGSGQALQLAAAGDVDLSLTHAPHLEKQWLESGRLIDRRVIMFNEFVLVGPESLAAPLKGLPSIQDACRHLVEQRQPLIIRADQSGTGVVLENILQAAGLDMQAESLLRVGQGMGATLRIAHEKQASTLVDMGTWLAYQSELNLVVLARDQPPRRNEYALLRGADLGSQNRTQQAMALQDWLCSAEGQAAIGQFKRGNLSLFYPVQNP